MAAPRVGVSLVTCNSEAYIERCLEALLGQRGVNLHVVVVDNGSTDRTREILQRYRSRLRFIRSNRNLGFARAQNQAIRRTSAPWVLALNPDVLLTPSFVRDLVEAGEADPQAGTVCGKLLSIGKGFAPLVEPRIDSAGIYFTPAMRHFDRGWSEPDDGRYGRAEYVFGASAAAALYRRAMIEDISFQDEFFDPDFFIYREDADVAWRAQLLGWRCLYTPSATGYHVRTVTPANRKTLAPVFNMHSVKNRFLMRIKNLTSGIWRLYWPSMTVRDLMVVGGCLLTEPRSLEALFRVMRCGRRAWARRRWIMSRRRVTDRELAQWFQFEPVGMVSAQTEAVAART